MRKLWLLTIPLAALITVLIGASRPTAIYFDSPQSLHEVYRGGDPLYVWIKSAPERTVISPIRITREPADWATWYEEKWQREAQVLANAYINPTLEPWYGCWETHTCPPIPISRIEYRGHREPSPYEGWEMVLVYLQPGTTFSQAVELVAANDLKGVGLYWQFPQGDRPAVSGGFPLAKLPRDEQFFREGFWADKGAQYGANVGCWERHDCPEPTVHRFQSFLAPGQTLESPLITQIESFGQVGADPFFSSPLQRLIWKLRL